MTMRHVEEGLHIGAPLAQYRGILQRAAASDGGPEARELTA
jgi:hypothetical protein